MQRAGPKQSAPEDAYRAHGFRQSAAAISGVRGYSDAVAVERERIGK
jgi:hypothetical protein